MPELSPATTGELCNCVNALWTWPSSSAPIGIPPPPLMSNRTPETLLTVETPSTSQSPKQSSPVRTVPALPQFTDMADPVFTWGEYDAEQFTESLNAAYAEAVHWKINLFKVPYGKAGKSFVSELARLFKAFATSSALESIALKAATLIPILLLQKPAHNSKAKDHTTCLERRLSTWLDGDLNELLREGRTIQQRILKSSPAKNKEHLARSFANLMFQGKTRAALRLLSDQSKGGYSPSG